MYEINSLNLLGFSFLLGLLFLLNNRGDEVSSLDEAAVFGVVLVDGSQFLFLSHDLDGFSGEGANRLIKNTSYTLIFNFSETTEGEM